MKDSTGELRTQTSRMQRLLLRNVPTFLSLVFLAVIAMVAIFAPWVAPYDPIEVDTEAIFEAPGPGHWFGTDNLGRDILSRIIAGSRISLGLGFMAVGIAGSLGIVLGLVAGYYGGWVDTVISRIVDGALAFPSLLLALAIVSVLGTGLEAVVVAVGVSSAPPFIRVVRSVVLAVRETDYVESARAIGATHMRIMMRHVLPNVFAPALVLATLGLARAIFAASSLSFLGVGAQPPTPEWGALISKGREHMRVAWWMSTFPGLAIFMSILAINLVGDSLRDILDPRLKH